MTEEINLKFKNLDQWDSAEIVSAIYDGQMAAIQAIAPIRDKIAKAVNVAASRLGENGRLIYVGAGTSGRLAVQDGSELSPTYNWPKERIAYAMAGGIDAMLESQEGAEDNAEDGRDIINRLNVGPNDVVLSVAASGRTPYTLSALLCAKSRGALTIAIANNPDTPLLKDADFGLLAETGGEIVAGSTRMKAGTAQKAILNMFSTTLMIRLGRVYDGFMVDMLVSNDKLKHRATTMVSEIAQCSTAQARDALAKTGDHIKKSVLICKGASLEQSEEALKQTGGNLRHAMDLLDANRPSEPDE